MSDFWKGFKLMKPEDNEVFCIAYGSNLDETRMKQRCPSAEVFGTSVIGGYRLLFKQSMTGAYATMEQDANCCVPVVIYRITAEDELKLDRFEGYPKYYYKRDFLLPVSTAFAEDGLYLGCGVNEIENKCAGILIPAFFYALQHCFIPTLLDGKYILYRFLSFLPLTIILCWYYQKKRNPVPIMVGHALIDMMTVSWVLATSMVPGFYETMCNM